MIKKLIVIFVLFLSPLKSNAAKILFFGDSHSVATAAPFGIRMNKLLRALPNSQVITHARCGSVVSSWYNEWKTTCGYYDQNAQGEISPQLIPTTQETKAHWPSTASTPKIMSIINQFKPNLIVVEMGGNYSNHADPSASASSSSEIKKFIDDIKALNIDCVWVGPPARRKNKEKIPALVATIKKLVEPTCEFVDSTTMTSYPEKGGDGTHYSFKTKTFDAMKIARQWADQSFITVKAHYDKL
jgi:hypothetical protein